MKKQFNKTFDAFVLQLTTEFLNISDTIQVWKIVLDAS